MALATSRCLGFRCPSVPGLLLVKPRGYGASSQLAPLNAVTGDKELAVSSTLIR
jgi:hypothetical protein